jgi:hypothetical protein
MSQTTIRAKQMSDGSFRIYFFHEEATRSYGGRIISTSTDKDRAVQAGYDAARQYGVSFFPVVW